MNVRAYLLKPVPRKVVESALPADEDGDEGDDCGSSKGGKSRATKVPRAEKEAREFIARTTPGRTLTEMTWQGKAAKDAASKDSTSSAAAGSTKDSKSSSAKSSSNSSKEKEEASATGDGNTDMKWVECGSGELHVNKKVSSKDGGKISARLVLRTEKTARLVINAPLFAAMGINVQNEKFIRFVSLCADEPIKMTAHLMRFKTKQEAQETFDRIRSLIASLPRV